MHSVTRFEIDNDIVTVAALRSWIDLLNASIRRQLASSHSDPPISHVSSTSSPIIVDRDDSSSSAPLSSSSSSPPHSNKRHVSASAQPGRTRDSSDSTFDTPIVDGATSSSLLSSSSSSTSMDTTSSNDASFMTPPPKAKDATKARKKKNDSATTTMSASSASAESTPSPPVSAEQAKREKGRNQKRASRARLAKAALSSTVATLLPSSINSISPSVPALASSSSSTSIDESSPMQIDTPSAASSSSSSTPFPLAFLPSLIHNHEQSLINNPPLSLPFSSRFAPPSSSSSSSSSSPPLAAATDIVRAAHLATAASSSSSSSSSSPPPSILSSVRTSYPVYTPPDFVPLSDTRPAGWCPHDVCAKDKEIIDKGNMCVPTHNEYAELHAARVWRYWRWLFNHPSFLKWNERRILTESASGVGEYTAQGIIDLFNMMRNPYDITTKQHLLILGNIDSDGPGGFSVTTDHGRACSTFGYVGGHSFVLARVSLAFFYSQRIDIDTQTNDDTIKMVIDPKHIIEHGESKVYKYDYRNQTSHLCFNMGVLEKADIHPHHLVNETAIQNALREACMKSHHNHRVSEMRRLLLKMKVEDITAEDLAEISDKGVEHLAGVCTAANHTHGIHCIAGPIRTYDDIATYDNALDMNKEDKAMRKGKSGKTAGAQIALRAGGKQADIARVANSAAGRDEFAVFTCVDGPVGNTFSHYRCICCPASTQCTSRARGYSSYTWTAHMSKNKHKTNAKAWLEAIDGFKEEYESEEEQKTYIDNKRKRRDEAEIRVKKQYDAALIKENAKAAL